MHHLFVTVLTTFIFFCSSFTFGEETLAGGWQPIPNVSDPTVVEIGKFAVDEHNKEKKASLIFGEVVKGESQIVAGTNYKLTIEASDSGVDNNYVALVWDKPWEKFRKLVSFDGPI